MIILKNRQFQETSCIQTEDKEILLNRADSGQKHAHFYANTRLYNIQLDNLNKEDISFIKSLWNQRFTFIDQFNEICNKVVISNNMTFTPFYNTELNTIEYSVSIEIEEALT